MGFEWKMYECTYAFQDVVLDELMYDKYQNSIMLRALKKNLGKTSADGIRMLTVSYKGKPILIGFQTLPHQMLFYLSRGKLNKKALEFYIGRLIEHGMDIERIHGESKHVKHFADIYSKATGKKPYLAANLLIYKLENLIMPEKKIGGQASLAKEENLSFLPHWGVEFARECNLSKFQLTHEYQKNSMQSFIGGNSVKLYVWREDENPRTCAALSELSEDTANVSFVYTPKAFRGKGYARANIYDMLNANIGKYPNIMLYADSKNPSSNKLYRKLGFVKIGVSSQYKFD